MTKNQMQQQQADIQDQVSEALARMMQDESALKHKLEQEKAERLKII